jgi:hypothetical protein
VRALLDGQVEKSANLVEFRFLGLGLQSRATVHVGGCRNSAP